MVNGQWYWTVDKGGNWNANGIGNGNGRRERKAKWKWKWKIKKRDERQCKNGKVNKRSKWKNGK